MTTACELLSLFDLDRPVRLLGVRLELATPAAATGTDVVGAGR